MKTKFTEFSLLHSQGFQWLQGFANLYERTNTHKYVLLYREGNAQCKFKQLSKCVIMDYEHTYIHKCLQLRTHHTHLFYGRHTYSMYKHGAISTQSIYISTVHTQESQTFSCAHCVHMRNHYALIRFVQTHTQTIAQMSYTQHAYLYMSLHPPAGSTLACTHTQKSQLCWCRFGSSCFHLTDIHRCLQTEETVNNY